MLNWNNLHPEVCITFLFVQFAVLQYLARTMPSIFFIFLGSYFPCQNLASLAFSLLKFSFDFRVRMDSAILHIKWSTVSPALDISNIF